MRSELTIAGRLVSGLPTLPALVTGAGLAVSILFIVLAISFDLASNADGAMFSYAVAVQDVWAFHWHNISGRMTVFVLTLLPSELLVGATASPRAGLLLYAGLFYAAPLGGLLGTFAADRSPGRIIFVFACASTALVAPLVFGFPTEMWMAQALFWPALAVCHYARPGIASTALVFVLLLLLAFCHEAAFVLLATILVTLVPRGVRSAAFGRALAATIAIALLAVAAKVLLPPDDYFGEVLVRAATQFFDPALFRTAVIIELAAALTGYTVLTAALSRLTDRGPAYAGLAVVIGLAAYWLRFDHAIHADSRYYFRTFVVLLVPAFAGVAWLLALYCEHSLPAGSAFARAAVLARSLRTAPLVPAVLLVLLIHGVETAKFIVGWRDYRAAVATLALGSAADPELGDPRFVSSGRIAPDLSRLSWFSTTPYLSLLVTNFRPQRLVVDPRTWNYYWLSCATATANAAAQRAVPQSARQLVRVYSCLHRK